MCFTLGDDWELQRAGCWMVATSKETIQFKVAWFISDVCFISLFEVAALPIRHCSLLIRCYAKTSI